MIYPADNEHEVAANDDGDGMNDFSINVNEQDMRLIRRALRELRIRGHHEGEVACAELLKKLTELLKKLEHQT